MRRIVTLIAAGTLALLGACGDDDDATPTTPPATTVAEPTTPPTTEPPTTTSSAPTTAAPTTASVTTVDADAALKAQIAADYVAADERLDELASDPTLDGLDERLAMISTPGSSDSESIREFISGMVERGEHVINGTPDYSTVTVESVELMGTPPYSEAKVTYCLVNNRIRVDSNGNAQPGTGGLFASRNVQTVMKTPNGWLGSSGVTELASSKEGETSCPAS